MSIYDWIFRSLVLKLAWKLLKALKFSNSLTFPWFFGQTSNSLTFPGCIATLLKTIKKEKRKKEKFQQLTVFELERIISFQKGGLSYHAIAARVQLNSSTVIQVWKQWTDKHRTTWKTGSGWQKVVSALDNQHLLCTVMNDCTTSSMQVAAHWSTTTGVLMSASSICRHLLHHELCTRALLYRIPLMANHQQLHLQWTREHRAWQADWHQSVFLDEWCSNL